MTSVCPSGHDSTADDYCDVCGAPIDSSAVSPASAPTGLTPPTTPVGGSAPAAPTGQSCPHCGTANVAEALFCESCGYDFTTGSMPRPLAPPDAAPAAPAASAAPATPAASASSAPSTFAWVAELWIDPAWYEAQDSPDPLPSAGLPDTIPLRGNSILVGRVSRTRNIHPDIDCGTDSGVSRRQAQLTTDGRRWFV